MSESKDQLLSHHCRQLSGRGREDDDSVVYRPVEALPTDVQSAWSKRISLGSFPRNRSLTNMRRVQNRQNPKREKLLLGEHGNYVQRYTTKLKEKLKCFMRTI